MMETKLAKLKKHWEEGNKREALRIAAGFGRLGAEKEDISRAWQATQTPDFYREIGQDPDDLIAKGYVALAARYQLT